VQPLDLGARLRHPLIRLGLGARDPLVCFCFDPLDLCVDLGLRARCLLPCPRQFALQATGLGFSASDPFVRLALRPLDAGPGVGLQLSNDGFRLGPQLVVEGVGFALELVDPVLGLAQLGR
jgi:hypothetical protein